MRLLLHCHDCSSEEKEHRRAAVVELREDNVYETVCEKGHRQFVIMGNPKWSLLFDAGALAMHDAYYREAIATFTAALENFWAFYIRVVARGRELPEEVRDELRKQTKLSERKFGAMCMAYAIERKEAYPYDPNWLRELRNPVVHEGRFASQADATKYGAHVFDAILAMAVDLMKAHEDAYVESIVEHADDAHREARRTAGPDRTGIRFPTLNVMTLLETQLVQSPRMSFPDALKDWSEFNWWAMAEEERATDPDGSDFPTSVE